MEGVDIENFPRFSSAKRLKTIDLSYPTLSKEWNSTSDAESRVSGEYGTADLRDPL